MQSDEIRKRFLAFFEKRGHSIIPSASLVPENDPTVLFNTAGMQPLIPYLLGEKHPAGVRLADVQKCVRTGDIEDIGDNRHLTFFEMLGNWSLGDYFKKESINWSMEFLTSKEEGLGLDPKRFYVTVFKGENGIPRDEESIAIWKEVFTKYDIKAEVAGEDSVIKDDIRIIPLGVKDNFWIAGNSGPCGGDTEIFYDTKPENGKVEGNFDNLIDSFRLIEVWNNVFMEFNKTEDGKYLPLEKKNVDTGMGLERTTAVVNGKSTVFDTDCFENILAEVKKVALEEKSQRIIADHFRTAVFMISDGVLPSNTDRGYILRRLIRRAIFKADKKELNAENISDIVNSVINKYGNFYIELQNKSEEIKKVIEEENAKFAKTIFQGTKEFEKLSNKDISGNDAFILFSTYGFPFEMTAELAKEKGINVDKVGFDEEFKKHQELSRVGAEKKFKGGMASTGEMETKYHTATHLLLASLRNVLKTDVVQKGSNITSERLRFDFNWPEKVTEDKLKAVENLINEKIQENIPVEMNEMPKEEAKKVVTTLSFDLSKYSDVVKVYKIGNFSSEFCGGPHVKNTSELGKFKIVKEEAVSAGVRRIKAVLE